jgi:hypothetical protein
MPRSLKSFVGASSNARFRLGCFCYLLIVFLVYCWGLATSKSSEGWSFLPTILLTLPWWPLITDLPMDERAFEVLASFYSLPVFLLSALLNISIAATVRFFLQR